MTGREQAHITVIDAAGFGELSAEAASVYGAAMQRSPEIVVQRRDVIATHLHHPGFVGVVARMDERLVGFGYGYRGAPGQWWYDAVARELGRSGTRRWLREGFELAELHVLPEQQGRGIGRELLLQVVTHAAARHVVLSTPDAESPARQLYRSQGFTDLLTDFFFPGSAEPYAVMGRDT